MSRGLVIGLVLQTLLTIQLNSIILGKTQELILGISIQKFASMYYSVAQSVLPLNSVTAPWAHH